VVAFDTFPVRNAMMQGMTKATATEWLSRMKKGVTGEDGIILVEETKLSSNTENVALAAGKYTRHVMDAYLAIVRPALVGGGYALMSLDERPWLTSCELDKVHAQWIK
jgi:hypothetical protein